MRSSLALFISSLLLFGLILSAQTVSEVEITAEPSHHLALQNQYVRVFKVEVAPHQATLMHRHRHDYIFVTLGQSLVENQVAGKAPLKLSLQDGETWFVPGGFAHIATDLADQPFRNITIELLQDAKARSSAPHPWDEDRGLHILNGGTQDILFVKDNARATELQLNPGGVFPKPQHARPLLLVAVTDLNLRSGVGGKSAIQLKAGDIAWMKAGFSGDLSNAGQQTAKFIILEFAAGSV